MIKTFEDAVEFVLANKVCTVFGAKGSPHPSLWDNTDLSEDKPDGGGWSPKVQAVWRWKNEIPNTYPDEVFYGKLPNGEAVLMEMEYLRTTHYPEHHKPVHDLGALAETVYAHVREEPSFTGDLRRAVIEATGCTKSRFDTALKKLQCSLNIVRSNDPALENDQWLPFGELYPDIERLFQLYDQDRVRPAFGFGHDPINTRG